MATLESATMIRTNLAFTAGPYQPLTDSSQPLADSAVTLDPPLRPSCS